MRLRLVLLGGFLLGLGCGSEPNPPASLPDPSSTGPSLVGHLSQVLTDSQRSGRQIALGVWYPAASKVPAARAPSTQAAARYPGTAPPASYPFDLFDPSHGACTSTDWEAKGYDPAYELATPKQGPFPLLMFSTARGGAVLDYVFIGARLASHGFVIAVVEHEGEGQWPWSVATPDTLQLMASRVKDLPFAISALLDRNDAPGDVLHGLLDSNRIAVSGHSLGGYTALAVTSGDDALCDTRLPFVGHEPWPYPPAACISASADPRVRAVITLDPSSDLLHYSELARISVPSLLLGELIGIGTINARPHAAIGRPDSYRVDVNRAVHLSFCNYSDLLGVLVARGLITQSDADALSASAGFPGALSQSQANTVTTRYMIAFLGLHLRGDEGYRSVLTPSYAETHEPPVQFITSETCEATLPDSSYFTYQGHQQIADCRVEQKDPTGAFFAP